MDSTVVTPRTVIPSVVFLRTRIPAAHPSSPILGEERMGSGVVVDEHRVLTAHYLLLGASEVEVVAADGRERAVERTVADHETGLGLLELGGPPLRPAQMDRHERIAPGLPVFLLTCASAGERKGATGHVSWIGPFEAFWEYMLDRAIMTTVVNPGLAGAPLFDVDARLIGIVSLGLAAVGRYSLAIPLELYLAHRAELFGAWACAWQRLPAVITRRVDSREAAFWARLKYRPYRGVIAISRAIETQLTDQGLDRARVHRIPSAVDTQRYRPDPTARARVINTFGLRDDALIVAVVAQLIARKGHVVLFAELPELVRRYPQLAVLCFGRGPLERQLRAQIAARQLDGHVRLVGFREDLADLLPGADVLVHPASREGLGVALLEALSCAVPVVACAAGGVVDVLRNDVHGLLVPVNDGLELQRALERLLADSTLRRRLGAAGRMHMQNDFSIAQMIAGHLQVYRHAAV